MTLEVLKPSELQTIELLRALEKVPNATRVEISLTDFERNTETLKVIVEGQGVNPDKLAKVIHDYGGVVQNIQHVLGER
ncbi:hypothetical protein KJ765_03685 [Candidatus Micrarchaeota archaeon]|nr:hypothetical protein [Candidatus Micrarchaeota archaeon]